MTPKHPFFQSKSYSIFIALLVPALFLMSCSLQVPGLAPSSTQVPPSPTILVGLATPTSIPPSPTPQVALETWTSIPIPPSPTIEVPSETPTSIPPSPTPQPTNTSVPPTGNIVFAPGTTAATLQGTVQPGQIVTYTAQAGIAQPMILILESPGREDILGVIEPNGTTLLDPAKKWSYWQWQLPETGLYTIQVIGGATANNYTLTVKIAELVYFAPSAHSITLPGNTYLGLAHSYAFRCSSGQIMTASLNVPNTKAFLDVFGLKTGSLLSYTKLKTSWTSTLPDTQTYVVEVIPRGGYLVSYSLTVTIP